MNSFRTEIFIFETEIFNGAFNESFLIGGIINQEISIEVEIFRFHT